MKIEFNYLAIRNTENNKLIDAIPLTDDASYDEVCVEYSADYVTEKDLIEWGRSIYGDRVYTSIGDKLDLLIGNGLFTLQDEARHLPSMGKMKLIFEKKEIDIE